ncbi:nicotinamide riboside transporter PnuC [Frondihabitans australicus]|uniref:Nicotinamide mononucleotide transporter n=1 Tax=Frondihabitans australicus TaxID=386892 RepID=A0A495ICU1_9MICO|nr:nicotinamide riboside transporter PnuC [Frondihabitans australicus]RKR73823.1 nicotinamide mononucleotide transporter [Frondihabitans australicus]
MLTWLAANWTEVLGFVTGAACVLLAARRHIANFPIGIANNLVFIWLFVGAALYADAGLQVVYLALGVAGWIDWARHRDTADGLALGSTPRRAIVPLALATIAMAAALVWILTAFTNSTTQIADATTTAVSLTAQYMLNRRWIENWFVWIAVDVAYVGLYLVKGLWITGGLYLLFIAMCAAGYRGWVHARRRQQGAGSGTPPTEAAHPATVPTSLRG